MSNVISQSDEAQCVCRYSHILSREGQWPELAESGRSGFGRENADFGHSLREALVLQKKDPLPVRPWQHCADCVEKLAVDGGWVSMTVI
jgi:hypothetical protein